MIRIHSSFHKCLTLYFIQVMNRALNTWHPYRPVYRHFESLEGMFYNNLEKYKLLSVNGFAVDTDRIEGEYRITRFIRDPRDLVVSGYFYHKRGAEPWFRFKDPDEKYWMPINGCLPDNFPAGKSYSEHLDSLSIEDGLMAEIQFRKYHLESMRKWEENECIKLFRYESIVGQEAKTFGELCEFLKFSKWQTFFIKQLATRYAARRVTSKHIRDPTPGQWKALFTSRVSSYFNRHYGDILERYGYKT